jgi:hypothetical protein
MEEDPTRLVGILTQEIFVPAFLTITSYIYPYFMNPEFNRVFKAILECEPRLESLEYKVS